ncbi:MAG: hypothetical protein QM728_08950 [Gordonia sp. (in: high G+C Gram-positive bacteria)]|uniref:hypothetical protein n=1 Tax=Gordonia sp. (in: high G+C Gram-positive bacteria) TaxID=84139 RepID=UPI0039E442C5
MKIDCDNCPGRPVACDGCMMNVLVGAPASAYPGEMQDIPSIGEQRADILVAIATLREAMLVTPAEARAAAGRIGARQGGFGDRFLTIVRAG